MQEAVVHAWWGPSSHDRVQHEACGICRTPQTTKPSTTSHETGEEYQERVRDVRPTHPSSCVLAALIQQALKKILTRDYKANQFGQTGAIHKLESGWIEATRAWQELCWAPCTPAAPQVFCKVITDVAERGEEDTQQQLCTLVLLQVAGYKPGVSRQQHRVVCSTICSNGQNTS